MEWESCGSTADRESGLRCVDQRCRGAPAAAARIAELGAEPKAPASLNGIYPFERAAAGGCATIRTVEVSDETTVVRLLSRGHDCTQIRLYPPTHEKALRIVDARTATQYPLIRLDGVVPAPAWNSVPREGLEVTATFAFSRRFASTS